jgi:hypothetical protein
MTDAAPSHSSSRTATVTAEAATRIQTEFSKESHAAGPRTLSQQAIMVETWKMPKISASGLCATVSSIAKAHTQAPIDAATVQSLAPMTRREEAWTCFVLFLLLGFMIWGVPVITTFAFLYPSAGAVVISLLLCSSCAECSYWEDALRSELAQALLKYFSLRIIFKKGECVPAFDVLVTKCD